MPEALSFDVQEQMAQANRSRYARRRALMLCLLRDHLAKYTVGHRLPSVTSLAAEMSLEPRDVAAALTALDELGEVVYSRTRGRRSTQWRLGPQEQHPDDVAFDQEVRTGIKDGKFRVGTPLPTAILAHRHGLDLGKLPRAFRLLIKDQLVAHRHGPAGPGHYVLPERERGAVSAMPPQLGNRGPGSPDGSTPE